MPVSGSLPVLNWSAAYIGTPWRLRGRSRDGLDCYGLVQAVYRQERGILLPEAAVGFFAPVADAPHEFDLVMFQLHGLDDHVGIVVEPGLMLHIEAEREACVERYDRGRLALRQHRVLRYTGENRFDPKPSAAKHVNLVAHPLLTGAGRTFAVAPGTSLEAMVALAFPAATEEQRLRMQVTINGHVIDAENWGRVRPFPGTLVRIDAVPGALNLRSLLSVVVSVAALAAGQWYAGALTAGGMFGGAAISPALGGALLSGAVLFTGQLLINAFLPVRKPEGREDRPQIEGWSNEARPDQPFPWVLGKRRHAPPYFGLPYKEIVGDDVYWHAGFIETLGDAVITEQKIGDTLCSDYDDISVQTSRPSALVSLTNYDHQVVQTDAMGVQLEYRPSIVTITNNGAGNVGNGVISNIQASPVALDGAYLVTITTAALNAGEFQVTGPGGYSRVGNVGSPLSGDVSFTISDGTIDFAVGDTFGFTVTAAASTSRITGRDAQSFESIFAFPSGLVKIADDGAKQSRTIPLRLRYRLLGTTPWTSQTFNVTAEKTEAFSRSFRITPAARGQYEVEWTRGVADSTDISVQDTLVWTDLYAHRPEAPLTDKFPVTKTAIRVRASKQLQGTLDAYNSIVSSVCPDWDAASGTWVTRETARPASLFRYALQGAQNAKPFADGKIDLPQVQDWHAFCAAKGLEYNRAHDFEATLPDVLADIALSGRATWRHDGVQWGVVIDRPRTIVAAHIGAHNTVKGSFGKSRSRVEFPDACLVPFFDLTNGYQKAERIVPWPGFVGTPSLVEVWDFWPGITDPAKIWVECRRRQYEAMQRRRGYSVSMDIESLGLERGTLVRLNHPKLKRGMQSARVLAVDGSIVTLDAAVTMELGFSYAVRFRKEDSVVPALTLLRTVETVVGETASLILTGSGDVPAEGNLALFGEAGIESIEAVVKSIERTGRFGAQLSLVDHAPAIDTLTDAEIAPAWDPRVGNSVDNSNNPAPLAPTITGVASGVSQLLVSLSPAITGSPTASYEVQHRLQGTSPWSTVTAPVGSGAIVVDSPSYVGGNVIEVRARAVGYNALASNYTAVVQNTFPSDAMTPVIARFDKTTVRFDDTSYKFDQAV